MGWISRFRESEEAELANPRNDIVINGTPCDADKAMRSGAKAAVPGDRPDAPIAEEIKRRQVSLAARYVIATRLSSDSWN